MDRIVSHSSSSTPWHVMSIGSPTRLSQSLRRQQDCHLDHVHYDAASGDGYVTKQSQVLERMVLSSANSIPVPRVGFPQDTQRVEFPSGIDAENGALATPLASAPRHQDTAYIYNNQHAQANCPVTTPATVYTDEARRSSTINGQPVQLPHYTIPVPIAPAHIPFQSGWPDTTSVDFAIPAHYDEVTQGRVSDQTAYPRTALSSPYTLTPLPHVAERPLAHPQDDEVVSRFGDPPFAHHATAGPMVGLAPTAVFPGYTTPLRGRAGHREGVEMYNSTSSISSRPSSLGPVLPPYQGSHFSDHLDSQNITTLHQRTSTAWFSPQPYLLPNQQTEIVPTPITTHISSYTLPALSQSKSNAQVVDLHASASIPPSPNLPVPLPGETSTHDSSSNIGNGNLPIPAGPPMTDYLPSVSMSGQLKGSPARSRTRVRYRMKTEGRSRLSERISTGRAGHLAETQSRTRMRSSAVCSPRDRNLPMCCGWQNEDGKLCSRDVTYNNCAGHFATYHDIKNMAQDVEVLCRWCALSGETKVTRKNILRHLREIHLCCPRLKKQECTDANNKVSSL